MDKLCVYYVAAAGPDDGKMHIYVFTTWAACVVGVEGEGVEMGTQMNGSACIDCGVQLRILFGVPRRPCLR